MYSNFPKAALIDMDGTLYDSMGNHAEAWMRMVREYGIEADRDEFFMYEGRTGASTINILFNRQFGHNATQQQIEEMYHKKTLYFKELPPVYPMPGALRLMQAFKHMGIKRVLVTGSGQNSLISRISTDFPDIFRPELRITSRDVTKGKPDPEPYLKAMDMALVEPWQSVAVENAPLGVESAARAGAFTVGVTTGPIPAEALKEAGADVVYKSMQECAEMLPQLLLKR